MGYWRDQFSGPKNPYGLPLAAVILFVSSPLLSACATQTRIKQAVSQPKDYAQRATSERVAYFEKFYSTVFRAVHCPRSANYETLFTAADIVVEAIPKFYSGDYNESLGIGEQIIELTEMSYVKKNAKTPIVFRYFKYPFSDADCEFFYRSSHRIFFFLVRDGDVYIINGLELKDAR